MHRDWAPLGADRFYNLVKNGYYNDIAFFRVVEGFMVQFGISGEPNANRAGGARSIPRRPGKQSNKRGMITFATSGPDMRTTQVFINYVDNSRLDAMGFAPFGKIVRRHESRRRPRRHVRRGRPRRQRPPPGPHPTEGNAYLRGIPQARLHRKSATLQ